MKTYFSIAAFLLLLTPLGAHAQTSPPSIDVSGSADVKVVPDEVFIVLGVETSDPSLSVAKSQNDETVRKFLVVTKEFQIDPKNVQTDFITIERWRHEIPNADDRDEFRVRKNIAITLKNITRFEELMSRAVELGITNIHGVQFRTSELRKHRDHAREMAIQAAREKAELLAAQLGRKVGPAIRISEYGGGWYSPYNWWGQIYGSSGMSQVSSQSGDASVTTGTIAFGQITVTAVVSVSFGLE
jgi:uncharacterized protein YggE